MAWSDETPADWIASWSEDSTDVTFPLASLTEELTAAEADGSTGDTRDILFSILEHTWQYYDALATADKPTKMTMTKSGSIQSDNTLRNVYTTTFYTDISGQDVTSE